MMKKIWFFLGLVSLMIFSISCGRKGPLEKPVPKIPQAVKDLEVHQQGSRLYFRWSNPTTDESGDELEVASAEIRIMEIKNQEVNKEKPKAQFLKYSKPVESLLPGKLTLGKSQADLLLNLSEAVGKGFLFAVRVKARKGHWSDFSNLVEVRPVLVPQPPINLEVEMEGNVVVLRWQAPEKMADGHTPASGLAYNVYRSKDTEFERLNDTPLVETTFQDWGTKYGVNYRYLVRALPSAKASEESEDSEVVSFTPADKVSPASPQGVQALVSAEGVVLSWLPNKEEDLAGYRVYRLKEGENQVLLTPGLLERVNYTDSAIEKDANYEYSITAVDRNNNESFPAKIKVKT